MHDPLKERLERLIDLTPRELAALDSLRSVRRRSVPAGQFLMQEGQKPSTIKFFVSGWAMRYKMLEDGRRQIIALLVPGDVCDLDIGLICASDHSVAALSPLVFAEIEPDPLFDILSDHPRVERALRWDAAVGGSIQREWIVSLGQRSAFERLGHCFCEMQMRLGAVGLTQDGGFDLPVTQADLADAMGLSTVHANRTIQELRQAGLIRLQGRELRILDFDRLARISLFNPNYLHLQGWAPDCCPRTGP